MLSVYLSRLSLSATPRTTYQVFNGTLPLEKYGKTPAVSMQSSATLNVTMHGKLGDNVNSYPSGAIACADCQTVRLEGYYDFTQIGTPISVFAGIDSGYGGATWLANGTFLGPSQLDGSAVHPIFEMTLPTNGWLYRQRHQIYLNGHFELQANNNGSTQSTGRQIHSLVFCRPGNTGLNASGSGGRKNSAPSCDVYTNSAIARVGHHGSPVSVMPTINASAVAYTNVGPYTSTVNGPSLNGGLAFNALLHTPGEKTDTFRVALGSAAVGLCILDDNTIGSCSDVKAQHIVQSQTIIEAADLKVIDALAASSHCELTIETLDRPISQSSPVWQRRPTYNAECTGNHTSSNATNATPLCCQPGTGVGNCDAFRQPLQGFGMQYGFGDTAGGPGTDSPHAGNIVLPPGTGWRLKFITPRTCDNSSTHNATREGWDCDETSLATNTTQCPGTGNFCAAGVGIPSTSLDATTCGNVNRIEVTVTTAPGPYVPQCSDGIDNEGSPDGLVDFDEANAQCTASGVPYACCTGNGTGTCPGAGDSGCTSAMDDSE